MQDNDSIQVIDNCFFLPLSSGDVALGFGARIAEWRRQTQEFRAAPNENADDSFLDANWPLSQFVTPTIPIALYAHTSENQMAGFLEACLRFRDSVVIRKLAILPMFVGQRLLMQARSTRAKVDTIKSIFELVTADARDMKAQVIVIPRMQGIETNPPYSGQYSLGTTNRNVWEMCWAEMCIQLSKEFPFISFKTPFSESFIKVLPADTHLVGAWLRHVLLPTRQTLRGQADFCRLHHPSLWRISIFNTPTREDLAQAPNRLRTLSPVEVDILISWQRNPDAPPHRALELDAETGCPRAMFGALLFQVPEHTHRLHIAAFRHLDKVPFECTRREVVNWIAVLQGTDAQGAQLANSIVELDLPGGNLTTQQIFDIARGRREQPVQLPPGAIDQDIAAAFESDEDDENNAGPTAPPSPALTELQSNDDDEDDTKSQQNQVAVNQTQLAANQNQLAADLMARITQNQIAANQNQVVANSPFSPRVLIDPSSLLSPVALDEPVDDNFTLEDLAFYGQAPSQMVQVSKKTSRKPNVKQQASIESQINATRSVINSWQTSAK